MARSQANGLCHSFHDNHISAHKNANSSQPSGWQIPDWFADATVLVCTDASERVVRHSLPADRTLKSVIVDRVDTYADTADIVDRVNVLLVSELRLHVPKPATAAETKLLAADAAG